MARRTNPEFDPTRIIQPTASPVDTFVQPNLNWMIPDYSQQEQIAQALSSLSPTMAELSATARKKEIEQAGLDAQAALDATAGDSVKQQALISKALENQGFLAPYRWKAILQEYGYRKTVEWQDRMLSRLTDLADPQNPDGTLRDPEKHYLQAAQEEWSKLELPDSPYIQQGAQIGRAKADALIRNNVGSMRAQLVRQRSQEALGSEFLRGLEAHGSIETDGKKSEWLSNAMSGAASQGMSYGEIRGVLVDTVLSYVAAERGRRGADLDGLESILVDLEDGKIGDHELPPDERVKVQQMINEMEDIRTRRSIEDSRIREDLVTQAIFASMDGVPASISQSEIDDRVGKAIAHVSQGMERTLSPVETSAIRYRITEAVTEAGMVRSRQQREQTLNQALVYLAENDSPIPAQMMAGLNIEDRDKINELQNAGLRQFYTALMQRAEEQVRSIIDTRLPGSSDPSGQASLEERQEASALQFRILDQFRRAALDRMPSGFSRLTLGEQEKTLSDLLNKLVEEFKVDEQVTNIAVARQTGSTARREFLDQQTGAILEQAFAYYAKGRDMAVEDSGGNLILPSLEGWLGSAPGPSEIDNWQDYSDSILKGVEDRVTDMDAGEFQSTLRQPEMAAGRLALQVIRDVSMGAEEVSSAVPPPTLQMGAAAIPTLIPEDFAESFIHGGWFARPSDPFKGSAARSQVGRSAVIAERSHADAAGLASLEMSPYPWMPDNPTEVERWKDGKRRRVAEERRLASDLRLSFGSPDDISGFKIRRQGSPPSFRPNRLGGQDLLDPLPDRAIPGSSGIILDGKIYSFTPESWNNGQPSGPPDELALDRFLHLTYLSKKGVSPDQLEAGEIDYGIKIDPDVPGFGPARMLYFQDHGALIEQFDQYQTINVPGASLDQVKIALSDNTFYKLVQMFPSFSVREIKTAQELLLERVSEP